MTDKQFKGVVVAATVLLGVLAYANTVTGDWVWDDVSSVLLHEHVQDPGQFFQLFREDQHAFGRGQGNFYRPLVSASFMLDYVLSYDPVLDDKSVKGYPDVKPFLFHLTNIGWHVAAAVLLFFFLGRLDAPRLVRAAVPLLFVLHPMHTEAVAYISGRADMMSATFILAALLCATATREGRWKWILLALSGVFFALGLCSKESTMIYPVLLAVVIAVRPKPDGAAPDLATWKSRGLPLALAAAMLVVYGALRATVLKFNEGGGGNGSGFGQRLLETGQAFAFYIKTLFIPTNLHMEQTLAGTPAWTAVFGFLCIAACVGGAVWSYKAGQRRITLGLCWFLAAWLPISGLFPLNAPMAEHWMYVPMAGFWWASMEALLLLSRRIALPALVPALATVLALVFLYQTVHRNRDWRDNDAIFRATLAANPDSLRVHANLATTYDYLEGNLPGARRHYEAVLALYEKQKPNSTVDRLRAVLLPDEIPIRLSLADVLLRQQAYSEALDMYGSLMSLAQDKKYSEVGAKAALGVGESLLGLGDYSRAVQAVQQALSLDPSLAPEGLAALRGAPLPDARMR